MHNFITKFRKILEITKQFAGNLVNEKGNVCRPGPVPKFSDLEVIALSSTMEAFGIDSENLLFNRLGKECPEAFPTLISRHQFNNSRCSIQAQSKELGTSHMAIQAVQKEN